MSYLTELPKAVTRVQVVSTNCSIIVKASKYCWVYSSAISQMLARIFSRGPASASSSSSGVISSGREKVRYLCNRVMHI